MWPSAFIFIWSTLLWNWTLIYIHSCIYISMIAAVVLRKWMIRWKYKWMIRWKYEWMIRWKYEWMIRWKYKENFHFWYDKTPHRIGLNTHEIILDMGTKKIRDIKQRLLSLGIFRLWGMGPPGWGRDPMATPVYNVASSLNLITGHMRVTMKDLKFLIKPFCLLWSIWFVEKSS